MIRKAFVMQVYPGRHDEYRQRHNPIWPELEDTLRSHGVRNYSIFLHAETNQLFAYAEIEDETQWENIAKTDICRQWWQHMRELMPSCRDNRPVTKNLEEVFHLA